MALRADAITPLGVQTCRVHDFCRAVASSGASATATLVPLPVDSGYMIGAAAGIGNQTEQQTSSSGYASSSVTPVHFGLGREVRVPRVEIVWPDGAAQQLRDVKADQVLVVHEAAASGMPHSKQVEVSPPPRVSGPSRSH